MPGMAAASIAACPRRSRPRPRSSPAPASTRHHALRLRRSRSRRPRKLLTVVTKSNAQRHGMVMWDEIAAEVAATFPTSPGTRSWSTP